ncbi:MAG: hypothetical protein JO325_03370 [Solirubrobacterales bacterium]|nr:hypothetical protein [Solirubrobacterales bacterium]
MPEGLSPSEVGEQIAEHRDHAEHADHAAHPAHVTRDRVISIVEAVLLSLVALMAAWSGYSAAKWGSESSLALAQASGARSDASADQIQATQIRTLDSVSFNAVEGAYVAHDTRLFNLAVRRLRAGYKPAFNAWLALHPLKNPNAPPDPSYMPQCRIPQQTAAQVATVQANAEFTKGESASGTADKYVRLTVILAAVLFLVGIGSRFPVRSARYGLIGIAAVLLAVSVVQLLGLPGPPS